MSDVPDQTPKPASPQDILDAVLQMPEDKVMPWEDVVLPSLGKYYDGAIPGGAVKVKPMGLAADKILATQRLAQSGKSIDWLFKKCVQFPDGKFDPLNLLAGDRIFLLYYLRGITHGNLYEFMVKCTNEDCGQASTHEYDLNLLSTTIARPKEDIGSEPFKVVLPHLTKVMKTEFWVSVRFMRGYDMQSMLTQRKVGRQVQSVGRTGPNRAVDVVDDTLEDNLNMLIMEAMSSKDRVKIKELVSRLHASDTAAIREFLRENSPGIETTIIINCPSCNTEMRMELPITESFFRPTAGGNSGK